MVPLAQVAKVLSHSHTKGSAMAWALHSLVGIAELVCFVLVIVQMFQHGQTGIAVACLVGVLLCLVGFLAAFVYGWMKAGEWRIQNIMYVWTGCIVLSFILGLAVPLSFGPGVALR
jgi:hypothetical protein